MVQTRIRSISSGLIFAKSIALLAAQKAISLVFSFSLAICLDFIPVLEYINTSEILSFSLSSLLVSIFLEHNVLLQLFLLFLNSLKNQL